MGWASRKRAEQRRAPAAAELPVPAVGAEPPLAQAVTAERLQNARPAQSPRRPPFHRPPPHAHAPLLRLDELCRQRAELEQDIAHEVAVLVGVGADWGSIGRALGVSRQAARQRYGTTHR